MKKKIIFLPFILAITAVITYISMNYVRKTGIFFVPGEIICSVEVTEEECGFVKDVLGNTVLKNDITVSARNSYELSVAGYLYNIYVPVTDFYDKKQNIASSEKDITYIPLEDLSLEKKLLSLDGKYFLEDMTAGAKFRYLYFEGEDISPLENILEKKSFMKKSDILAFTQTGVTALSRRMNTKMYSVGSGEYFVSSALADFLSKSDYVHTSNESSFSASANGGNICSDPRFLATLKKIHVNIVELTGNHNLDCGIMDAMNTIDIYKENGISVVGGGKNLTEAETPLEISKNNNNITMLAINYSTGGMTYGDTPGANPYNEELLTSQIMEAKNKNHFVIIDVQFNECNLYANDTEDTACDYADSSAPRDGFTQSAFFKHLVDLGADMVVGTSAHQTQTFELYNGKPIFYGLGNLFFDQTFWADTHRSLMLTSYFVNNKLINIRISGTNTDDDYVTDLMPEVDLENFLERLSKARN